MPPERGWKPEDGLKQELRQWQIFFIVLTNVIGGGIFTSNGEALEIAGPAGYLTAIIVFGLISIAVLDGISEFTQLFPAYNALPKYTKAFIDRDLSWVVGIAYWYTYASTFAVQNLSAANLIQYWGASQFWQTMAFYILAPIVIFGINLLGVFAYGWIETISGALKICLAVGIAIVLYVVAGAMGVGNVGPISDGYQYDKVFADNRATAMCYAIPLVAFSYLGQEIFVVTSYEAKYSRDLRLPSRILPYVVVFLYLLIGIGESLTVKWTDSHLPSIFGGKDAISQRSRVDPNSSSMVIIAAFNAGYRRLAGFLNGCLIFSVLSSGNTGLYAASRVLHGLATEIPDTNFIGKRLQFLKVVIWRTGVPGWSLVVTAFFFFWLPFLQLKNSYPAAELQQILATSGSITCMMVWLVLCIAFIRYCNWLSLCKDALPQELPDYVRNSATHKASTVFGFAQPAPAWLGLIGTSCVLIFASAAWWNTHATFAKVAAAYIAPIILILLWLLIKLVNYRNGHGWGFVAISADSGELSDTLAELRYYKRDESGYSGTNRPEQVNVKGVTVTVSAQQDDNSSAGRSSAMDDRRGHDAPEALPMQTSLQSRHPSVFADEVLQGPLFPAAAATTQSRSHVSYQPLPPDVERPQGMQPLEQRFFASISERGEPFS